MTVSAMKCVECGESKPIREFYKRSGGTRRDKECKDCHNKKRREKRRVDQVAYTGPLVDKKYCKGCGETKSSTQFHRDSSSKDGLAARCKECVSKYHREKYIRDDEYREINIKRAKDRQKSIYSDANLRAIFRDKQNSYVRKRYAEDEEYRNRMNSIWNDRDRRKRWSKRENEEFEAFMARMEREALEAGYDEL